jgi:hypothetical protein
VYGRPRWCLRCKRADCGDGVWVKSHLWQHDKFLRQTNMNIRKYGEIKKLDACDVCVKEIESRGHKVRCK